MRYSQLVQVVFLGTLLATSAFAQTPKDTPADWGWNVWGGDIGIAGMSVVSNGSQPELVIGARRYWSLVHMDPKSFALERVWQTPPYAKGLPYHVLGGRVLPKEDGVLVGRSDGVVEIWSVASRQLVRQFPSSLSVIHGLAFADLDGSPGVEIAVASDSKLAVLDTSGKLLWSLAGPAYRLRIGQLDADPGLEIVAQNGRVVDVATRKLQWVWNKGFGGDFAIADADGDSKNELICLTNTPYVEAFDVAKQVPKWSFGTPNGIHVERLLVLDIDKDAQLELVLGDSGSRAIYGVDAKTHLTEWSIPKPDSGTAGLCAIDLDQDGSFELCWSSGHRSSADDRIHVGTWKLRKVLWTSEIVQGPFSKPRLGDIDGDAKPELVTLSRYGMGNSAGRILVFDAGSFRLRELGPSVGSRFQGPWMPGLQLVDVDQDPERELVTVGDKLRVWDYSPAKGFVQTDELDPPEQARCFVVADLDGQAGLEIAVGTDRYLYRYDLATKKLLSKSTQLGGYVEQIVLKDVDLDASDELVLRSEDGNFYVFDAATGAAEAVLQPMPSRRHRLLSILPTSASAGFVVGTDDRAQIYVYVPNKASYLRIGPLPTLSTWGFDSFQILGSDLSMLWAQQGRMQFGFGPLPIWQSADYGLHTGRFWNLVPAGNRVRLLTSHLGGLIGFDF